MKRITELSSLRPSLKIARIVFLADLLLIAAVVNAEGAQAENVLTAAADNKAKPEKKESRMDANEVAKTLGSLCQYTIDESFLLSQTIEKIDNKGIGQKFVSFKDEAEGFIKELSDHIRKLGKEPPNYSRDFKGFLMQGWEAIRGLASDEGVLQALQTNIQRIIKAYEEALRLDLPGDAKAILLRISNATQKLNDHIVNEAIPQSRAAAS
jgi:uncharacterized protein (TIGR02284 family)